jgi:hypothetical protein
LLKVAFSTINPKRPTRWMFNKYTMYDENKTCLNSRHIFMQQLSVFYIEINKEIKYLNYLPYLTIFVNFQ